MNIIINSLIWIVLLFFLILLYNYIGNKQYIVYNSFEGYFIPTKFITSNNVYINYDINYCIEIPTKEIDSNNTYILNDIYVLENPIMVLPLPKIVKTSNDNRYIISLDTIVKITGSIMNSNVKENIDIEYVNQIINRFMNASVSKYYNIKSSSNIDILSISTIELILEDSLSNQNDEYSISIDNIINTITIKAKDNNSVRAAFITLFQILDSPIAIGIPLYIHDWSEYAWRGILVDIARHYQPIELLIRCLDAMELAKFNTLHLHITDSQSFPLLLDDVYDEDGDLQLSHLALNGSFSSEKIYSKNDLKDIIEHANMRGITIIPEIDIPAHTLSWNRAFKGIVVNCSITANKEENSDNVYVLDPSAPQTIKVVKAVLKQISELFPSSYIHIGGDEVNLPCWQESMNLKIWNKFKNQTLLESYENFEAEIIQYIKSLNKIPIVWQGVQDSNAIPVNDTSTVIQPWKCWSNLALRASTTALSHGNPLLLSACMYLDYDEDWISYLSSNILASAKGIMKSFDDFNNSSRTPYKQILGGEGSLWSEHVDQTNFECRIWPRAIAIAQLLWGKPYRLKDPNGYSFYNINPISDKLPLNESILLYSSFVQFRKQLIKNGISAALINFHIEENNEMKPIIVDDEFKSMKLIFKIQKSYSVYNKLINCNIRITAQCLGIPQIIQRPIFVNSLSFAQLNVGEGGSETSRKTNITNWMIEKANLGYIGLGFCELNGWQDVESKTILLKNLPKINFRAASGGFVYSHIMVNTQPYNIGYVSSIPFEVIGEYGPPLFQRGLLHIYYKRYDLHIMIVHLHAHSSLLREVEVSFIAKLIQPLLNDNNKKVMIMGDFNTFSSFDKKEHEYYNISTLFKRTDNDVFIRLKQKYMDANGKEILIIIIIVITIIIIK
jgi:hexosaminidase